MTVGLRAGVANDGYLQINGVDVVTITQSGITTPPVGQCRLTYISTTQVRLVPYNGNQLTIAGRNYTIPSTGVNLASTGLTLATNYYVYAYMSGATMTLEPSATTHVTDTSTGVEIKSGDPTRSLVGFVRISASSAIFVNQNDTRYVLSWYNRRALGLNATSGATGNWSGTTPVDLNALYHANFLVWSDDTPTGSLYGTTFNNTAGSWVGTQLSIDGTTTVGEVATIQPVASYPVAHAVVVPLNGISEGNHYITMLVYIANGGTGTWNPFRVTTSVQG